MVKKMISPSNDYKKCINCGVCANVCKSSAIFYQKNNEGFYYAKIDKNKCINCLQCQKKCIANSDLESNQIDSMRAYAGKYKFKNDRIKSTSGGFCDALSKYVIENNGCVFGVAYSEDEVENLVNEAKEWISKEESRRHPQLDLYGEEREACDREREEVRRVLSNVSNILLNGCDLILDRTFDRIGFNRIDDEVFRKLVKARLAYPTSKAATVEYLKNHFDEDLDLSKIYRYLDKLSDHQHEIVQDISVRHTAKLFGGNIGVLFYDVTTLYFEADYEDDLRKTGFSKEGRHSNPQIILGLLVSLGGYPLAYCIHEGNKYEGHTMLPTINEFVSKYGLENFVVVADSGLMNNANITELEAHATSI